MAAHKIVAGNTHRHRLKNIQLKNMAMAKWSVAWVEGKL
jgi:hypothetical protein